MLSLSDLIQRVKSQQKQPSLVDLWASGELAALSAQASLLETSASTQYNLLSQQAGWMPTKPLGSGMDYAESRVYQAGDDRKSINWRLSARAQETFVKTYHKESRPTVCIVLDQRLSMLFGTRGHLKIIQALRVAALLALAAEQHQLGFNCLLLGDQLKWQTDYSAEALVSDLKHTDTVFQAQSIREEVSLKSALVDSRQYLNKGSLVYIISDFMDIDSSDQPLLMGLRESCYVQAIHIMDQAELELPDVGDLHLQNRKRAQNLTINTSNNNVRQSFNQYINAAADTKQQLISDVGMPYHRVMTDIDALYPYLTLPLGVD